GGLDEALRLLAQRRPVLVMRAEQRVAVAGRHVDEHVRGRCDGHRWMRLLVRLGIDQDALALIEAALILEALLALPALQDEVEGLQHAVVPLLAVDAPLLHARLRPAT